MAGGSSVKGLTVAASARILMALAACAPLCASHLTITPTFDASITSDANAAAIEGVINSAIAIYEADFSNPINVTIDFQEMSSGLGQSNTTVYGLPYSTFYTAYQTNATNNNNVTALAALGTSVPNQPNDPVNGDSILFIKTANIRALGINCCPPSGGFDGVIGLNTSITFPPNAKSGSTYSLMATAEHEIDEVLGLGSSLGSSLTEPQPEDLFRYDSLGNRTFTTSSGALAYFSVTGKTADLAQFDNQNDGGDFGDWQSNPLPGGVQPKVQDAFATPNQTPQLTVELVALQAVGYDSIPPSVPEPSSVYLFIVALPVFGLFARWRIRLSSSQLDESPARK